MSARRSVGPSVGWKCINFEAFLANMEIISGISGVDKVNFWVTQGNFMNISRKLKKIKKFPNLQTLKNMQTYIRNMLQMSFDALSTVDPASNQSPHPHSAVVFKTPDHFLAHI